MSRYLLLFLLNLPFILTAMLSAITQYKLKRSSRRRLIVQMFMWLLVLVGLLVAEPIYSWLFQNNLTQTEPLSLFDVVQITAIVVTFYVANRTRIKLNAAEKRLQDLHQELSLRISQNEK